MLTASSALLTAKTSELYVRNYFAKCEKAPAITIIDVRECEDIEGFNVRFFLGADDQTQTFTVWLEQAANGSFYLYGEW